MDGGQAQMTWHSNGQISFRQKDEVRKKNYLTFFYWTCALSFFLQLSQCFIAFRVRYLIHGLKNVSLPLQGGCHLVALKVSNRDLKISTIQMHTISQQALPLLQIKTWFLPKNARQQQRRAPEVLNSRIACRAGSSNRPISRGSDWPIFSCLGSSRWKTLAASRRPTTLIRIYNQLPHVQWQTRHVYIVSYNPPDSGVLNLHTPRI